MNTKPDNSAPDWIPQQPDQWPELPPGWQIECKGYWNAETGETFIVTDNDER